MSHHLDDDYDVTDFLASIDDAAERARFRREFGLLDEDEDGTLEFDPPTGPAYEAQLGRAIIGGDRESYLGGLLQDEKLVSEALQEETQATAERARAAVHLSRTDVQGFYDATSFLGQEYGLTFNSMITVAYAALGLTDPAAMTKLLTEFLDEAGDQVERWGHPWHAVYVHENSAERGLHTHILATIYPAVRKKFEVWARDGRRSFFRRHCGVATPEAVHIVIKAPTKPSSAVGWQWDRVQYITKGMDPTLTGRDATDGSERSLFELLRVKERYRDRPAGIIPFRQRVGGTQSIWSGAQERAAKDELSSPMLSAFGDGAWPYLHLDSCHLGWELQEYRVRQQMRREREGALLFSLNDYEFEGLCAFVVRTGEWPRGVPLTPEKELELRRRLRSARLDRYPQPHPFAWDRPWWGWWHALPGLARWGSRGFKARLKAFYA